MHDYNCSSKSDLYVEERRVLDLLKPNLNKQIPTRTDKEYREDNKVKKAEMDKKYREDNKEILLEKKKEKCKCDICGAESNKTNLARHKKSQKCLSVKNNM